MQNQPLAEVIRDVQTSPTLLFRYSTLTFNGHRIHDDLPYATVVEGYAGLVVHGTLQASLLFNLAATIGVHVPNRFQYRGLAPLICGHVMQMCGNNLEVDQKGTVKCRTETTDGVTRMEGTATW